MKEISISEKALLNELETLIEQSRQQLVLPANGAPTMLF